MKNPYLFHCLILFALIISSCASTKRMGSDEFLRAKAHELSQKFIIVDGHVDLPSKLKVKNFKLQREYLGIPITSKDGDFDYQRAKAGGLDAPFMSVYIPSSLDTTEAKSLADSLIQMITWIAIENPDYFALAKSPEEVIKIKSSHKIALPMGMENGSPITKLSDISMYRGKGISYVTLTHAKDNQICDSSYDTMHTHNGLSDFGYLVVPELARQGILIDISHVSDSTFYDVLAITPVPLIASHSSARAFTPDFERNMSDDMIRKMGGNGGVIMINFGSTFLDGEVTKIRNYHRALLDSIYEGFNVNVDSEQADSIRMQFYKDHPAVFADVEKVADHIDHVVKIAGIDHVGFGSDFDGVGDSLPTGLKDVSDYPNLIYTLLKRGYSESDIEKICYKNLFRVWNNAINYSIIQKNQ